MSNESLTAKEVEHMKPREARYEVPAGDPPGTYLVVNPSGAKSWAFRYRWLGKTRKLTLGTYPKMKLAAARGAAEAAVANLDKGIDPAAVKAEEDAREPRSVEAVTEEWLTRYVKPNTAEKSAIEFERIVRREMQPAWKHKRITDVTKPDVLKLLDTIVDRGASIMANRVYEVIRMFFNWSVKRGYLDKSPAAGTEPPTVEKSRERVLSEVELTEIWTVLPALGYPVGPFVRFLLLTAQRRGEGATMKWADVDLENAMWTLPAEAPKQVNKAARVHDVPLSPAAVEILEQLPRFKYINDDGEEVDGEYIWTTTSGRKAINGFSKLKTRIDSATLARRAKAGIKGNIADWTLHDLRRTATTHMAKTVPPHVLAAILNHLPESVQGVTSIYNRFRYTEERRAALEAWAEYLGALEKPAAQAATA